MADLSLTYGGDLGFSASGDLALATRDMLTRQRVLRRLLTTPGDYIWNLSYGAGLGQYVGAAGGQTLVGSVATAQMRLESRVAAQPAPTVDVTTNPGSGLVLTIRYADASGGGSAALALPVSSSAQTAP